MTPKPTICFKSKTRFTLQWKYKYSQTSLCTHLTEFFLASSKLKERLTVPLPKLTLGFWLCLRVEEDSVSFPLVFMLTEEAGEEAEDPPTLLDLFLEAELCRSVALAAALKE